MSGASPYRTTLSGSAASRDLTTLATMKLALGLTDSSQDAWLSAEITQASQVVASYCARVFAQETLIDSFRLRGCRGDRLNLSRAPVASITSVVEDDVTLTATLDYEFDVGTGYLWRLDGSDNRTVWTGAKVVVTFVAGYELLQTLPNDVERACIILVRDGYFAKARGDSLARSERVETVGIETIERQFYQATATGSGIQHGSEAASLLSTYRAVLAG